MCVGVCIRVLEFYVLATSKVIAGWILTCDSAHSWSFYSAALLGYQTHDRISHSITLF